MKLMPMWTKADIWSDDGVTMAIIWCSICAMHKFLRALNAQWNTLLVECTMEYVVGWMHLETWKPTSLEFISKCNASYLLVITMLNISKYVMKGSFNGAHVHCKDSMWRWKTMLCWVDELLITSCQSILTYSRRKAKRPLHKKIIFLEAMY